MLNPSGWLSDINFGLRLLRRNPEVTIIAVLAMAIAIGVAGTVFSVANAVLIQPLPFNDPERLVAVWQVDPQNPALWRPAAAGNYDDWRRMSQSFEKAGAAIRTTPEFFNAMKIPLVQGRLFTENDNANAPLVALVSSKMARQLWGAEDPLGKRLAIGNNRGVMRQVVGVVADVRTDALPPEPQPTMYLPLEQDTAPPAFAYVVRTTSNPMAYLQAATEEVRAVDRAMPVYLVRTMADIVSGMDWRTRFVMSLLAIFSVLSLLLAITGIYAAVSYVVSQQTREIGIRMALGAQKREVLKMVLANGMLLTFIGVVVGLLAAVVLTRLMSSLLFGVTAYDPMTFISISLLLAAVTLVACYVPARRATKIDPLVALRHE